MEPGNRQLELCTGNGACAWNDLFMVTVFLLCPASFLCSFCLLSVTHLLRLLLSPAASGNPTYACQLAMTLLTHPPFQVALAAWVAVLAGFAAWYLLWACSASHLWVRSRGHCRILPNFILFTLTRTVANNKTETTIFLKNIWRICLSTFRVLIPQLQYLCPLIFPQ